MKVVLIALLYATPTAAPVVNVVPFVYDDAQICYQDSVYLRDLLLYDAPNESSDVVTYCVILSDEA